MLGLSKAMISRHDQMLIHDVPAKNSATWKSSNCEHFSRFHMPVSIPFLVTWYEIKNGINWVTWRIVFPRNAFWSHDKIFNGSSVIAKDSISAGGAPIEAPCWPCEC